MKQQTAVEFLQDNWLNEQFWSYEKIDQWFKQAKEMEKQQIIDAINYGIELEKSKVYVNNETYGSKGSDETKVVEFDHLKKEAASSQTEISDEEIEKIAKDYMYNDKIISISSFEEGAKWYREQLKK